MAAGVQKTLTLINGHDYGKSDEGRCEISAKDTSDVEFLDAYSRAVTAVVDAVGPAVVSISVEKASPRCRLVRFHHLEYERAVEVMSVAPDSPAKRAGIRESDVIYAINEQVVKNIDDLHRFLAEWPPDRPVTLNIIRGKELVTIDAVPVEAGSMLKKKFSLTDFSCK